MLPNMPGESGITSKAFHSFNFASVASDGTTSPLSENLCIVQHDENVKEAQKVFK